MSTKLRRTVVTVDGPVTALLSVSPSAFLLLLFLLHLVLRRVCARARAPFRAAGYINYTCKYTGDPKSPRGDRIMRYRETRSYACVQPLTHTHTPLPSSPYPFTSSSSFFSANLFLLPFSTLRITQHARYIFWTHL